jgi:hypothetical protein
MVYQGSDNKNGTSGWKDNSQSIGYIYCGRNIMNSILDLHEILHRTRRRGITGVVLKLDFEKVYDKAHWGFLLDCLTLRGFNDKWVLWIKSVLLNGIVAVKLNGNIGSFFQVTKE